MSSGCVHSKASLILAGGFLLGGLVTGHMSGVEYAVGSVIGIFLSPDLDVDSGNLSVALIKNRIGTIPAMAWRLLWRPYSTSLKHGGSLSHLPVISTMFRLAYLFLFLLVIPYIVLAAIDRGAWTIQYELQWWFNFLIEHYRVILGLMASDLIHWALDILTTEHATKQKRKIMIFGLPLASSTC